jgi:hypothetical protein
MFNARKAPHLFGMPYKYANEPSVYMQKKYNLTPSGEPKPVKEQSSNFNPLQDQLKKETAPVTPEKSNVENLDTYSKGGKVAHDWHGFGKSSTGKHKHGF